MVSIPPGRTAGDRGIGAVSAPGRCQHRRLVAARRRRQDAARPTRAWPSSWAGPRSRWRGCRPTTSTTSGARCSSPPTWSGPAPATPGTTTSRPCTCGSTATPIWLLGELATDPRRRRRRVLGFLHRYSDYTDRRELIDTLERPRAAARHRPGDREHRQLGVGRRAQPHDLVRRAVPDLRRRPGGVRGDYEALPGVHPPRRPRGRAGRGRRDVRRRRRVRVERPVDPRRRRRALVPRPRPGRARRRRHGRCA